MRNDKKLEKRKLPRFSCLSSSLVTYFLCDLHLTYVTPVMIFLFSSSGLQQGESLTHLDMLISYYSGKRNYRS